MPLAITILDDRRIADAYDAYAPGLRRFVTARTRDVAQGEDIAQEAFMRLAVESRAGRAPTNVRAWLYRVAHNLLVSGTRHTDVVRRRTIPVTLDDVTSASPEDAFIDRERRAAMTLLLASTSPAARTALALAAQGYAGHEIATAIGRTDAATRALMCRTRSDLRAGLARTYSDVA